MYMSEDEVFASLISLALAAFLWGRWFYSAKRPGMLVCPWSIRGALVAAPAASLLLLVGVLLIWADAEVRVNPQYLGMYTAMGAAWVGVALLALPFMGIDPVMDVIHRRNPAAAWAVAGTAIGLTAAFAGGNIGDGPGWWVVVFSAALGTAGMFILWGMLDVVTGISSLVTVERDTAAGIRLGALLAALGAISGRAVAGDWVSVPETMEDFLTIAWPGAGLVLLEGILGLMMRPTPTNPRPSVAAFGVLPAVMYLFVAGGYLALLGWWM
jgi:hypothetical protein